MKKLLFILLLCLLAPSIGCSNQTQRQTYKNQYYNFKIEIPSGYNVEQYDRSNIIAFATIYKGKKEYPEVVIHMRASQQKKYPVNATYETLSQEERNRSLKRNLEIYEESYGGETGFNISVSFAKYSLFGNNCFQIYSALNRESNIIQTCASTMTNGMIYYFNLESDPNDNTAIQEFTNILETFKLLH